MLMVSSHALQGGEIDEAVSQSKDTIEQTLDRNRDAIMALPNVVGAGISQCGDEICIRVLVSELSIELAHQIEELIGQHHYVVELTGPLQSLPAED